MVAIGRDARELKGIASLRAERINNFERAGCMHDRVAAARARGLRAAEAGRRVLIEGGVLDVVVIAEPDAMARRVVGDARCDELRSAIEECRVLGVSAARGVRDDKEHAVFAEERELDDEQPPLGVAVRARVGDEQRIGQEERDAAAVVATARSCCARR